MRRISWIAALALITATALAQSEPPECAGLSAQVRANYMEMRDGKLVPVCPVEPQAAREAADPCKQLGSQATELLSNLVYGGLVMRPLYCPR